MSRRSLALCAAAAAATLLTPLLAVADTPPAPMGFGPAVALTGAAGGTEPRATYRTDPATGTPTAYVATNLTSGEAATFQSTDGATWTKSAGTLANQDAATIDVDIVTTAGGRLVASELDTVGINFRNSYSDDGGKTWTASTGLSELVDTDRQWLATGPNHRVYLMWHNLATGIAAHNMWVQTSDDDGASFGVPVPVTLPGSQAYGDLQCSDSGGPSNIAVDQTTGRIYVAWGTRTGPEAGGPVAGGCTAGASGSVQFNIVSATREWVAYSDDNSPGSWTSTLAFDKRATNQVVGMQLCGLALDTASNAYVACPVSTSATDYSASIELVTADRTLSRWSAPKTVQTLAGTGGNLLPHVVAGDPGRVDVAFMSSDKAADGKPVWYSTAAQSLNALDATPTFTTTRLSPKPTYRGTANQLMGRCAAPGASTPVDGLYQGLGCSRSTDVYGIALSPQGRLLVAWPSIGSGTLAPAGGKAATTVIAQTSGPSLFATQAP